MPSGTRNGNEVPKCDKIQKETLGLLLELRDERHIIEPSLPPTVLPGEMVSWRKTLNRCEIDHLFVFLGQNNIRAETKSGT